MPHILGEIIGPDLLIILAVVALLFGSSQLPKLARSLGRASKEFRDGLAEGARDDDEPQQKS
jgi:sec-independent protein translocase protein TatA